MQIKFANKLQVHIADLMWNADKEMVKKILAVYGKECVGLVNEHQQHNNPNDSLLALKIKEYFGVEE